MCSVVEFLYENYCKLELLLCIELNNFIFEMYFIKIQIIIWNYD